MNFNIERSHMVKSEASNKIVGILEYGPLMKEINIEVFKRQEAEGVRV